MRRVESAKCELPPSMRMSPGWRSGTSSSITSSTAAPALTMIMILRGGFKAATSSSTECVPTIFFPLARPSTNASTFDVVRLKTATVNPWLSMFRTRFSPITARPISPMSALFGFVAMLVFSSITGVSEIRCEAGIVTDRQRIAFSTGPDNDPRDVVCVQLEGRQVGDARFACSGLDQR